MKQRAGLILLIAVALAVVIYSMIHKPQAQLTGPAQTQTGQAVPAAIDVHGYIGGEKLGFLADPDVTRILKDKYGIHVDATKLGSIEMVQGQTAGQDFLWPSSQVAQELYKERGGKMVKSDIIFNSPIVLYSWDFVTDALIKAKVVSKQGAEYYIVDLPKLIDMVNKKTKWKDIGLDQLYGAISVRSTDPAKSNSGMMFAGLMANISNGGEVVDDSTVTKTLPTLKSFFGRLGYMEGSSADQFDQFLKMGEGANPLVVGYESQLVEFGMANSQYRDMLKQRIRILYPRPTVWSSHPMIALNDKGAKLLDALQDPEIQKIAWEQHGFRSGLLGAQNDPKVLQLAGIPAKIENVIPMPTPRVMERIIKSVGGE
ncbi:hypothetical protein CCAX7_51420 [Capsulimonas corticalis]|uniref:Uncharacterized protein n=1 Tax=Capsulimonas corticalis TaxID=2219043 RepID=A0A402CP87_9BACT|nr:hypothetical protein [Capsulimonas corticalis]BDI33091.1 hypothetical protein CCAX7_51420 [Capsulimonas corticalis]